MGFDAISATCMKYKLIYTSGMLTVKGNGCISSYDENVLIIKCGKENIFVTGHDFVISSMNADEITVCGSISSISFE